jgi:uncharacterized membrane protein
VDGPAAAARGAVAAVAAVSGGHATRTARPAVAARSSGVVGERDVREGRIDVKSDVGEDPYVGTASGGLIGLLIGIIGGPLGMLIGGAYGMLVGALFDIDEVDTTESVLGEISKQVQPTRTAVLAQVTEQTPEVIDAAMARLGGEVLRRPAVAVEEEIAVAEEAQRKAKDEARKELHKARVEQTKADAHAKVEEMKAKLHRSRAGASA